MQIQRLPDDIARCPGRDRESPGYLRECCHCMRMLSPPREGYAWQTYVAPWIGHGDCPDKIEMEK